MNPTETPKLEPLWGTEKQVAWGNILRDAIAPELVETVQRLGADKPNLGELDQAKLAMCERMLANRWSGWWIEHRAEISTVDDIVAKVTEGAVRPEEKVARLNRYSDWEADKIERDQKRQAAELAKAERASRPRVPMARFKLAPLQGTEEQVRSATFLRDNVRKDIAVTIAAIEAKPEMSNLDVAKTVLLRKAVDTSDATWWLDRRNDFSSVGNMFDAVTTGASTEAEMVAKIDAYGPAEETLVEWPKARAEDAARTAEILAALQLEQTLKQSRTCASKAGPVEPVQERDRGPDMSR